MCPLLPTLLFAASMLPALPSGLSKVSETRQWDKVVQDGTGIKIFSHAGDPPDTNNRQKEAELGENGRKWGNDGKILSYLPHWKTTFPFAGTFQAWPGSIPWQYTQPFSRKPCPVLSFASIPQIPYRQGEAMTRTGQQYLDSLHDGRQVYLDGELVTDVVDHPAYRNAIKTIATLYDFQARPENLELMTFKSPTSGERVQPQLAAAGVLRGAGHPPQVYGSLGRMHLRLHGPFTRPRGLVPGRHDDAPRPVQGPRRGAVPRPWPTTTSTSATTMCLSPTPSPTPRAGPATTTSFW